MLLRCCTFGEYISMVSSIFSPGQSVSGSQTITSTGGIFELGFFTPDTWLPGARLGYNKLTKEKVILTPWRTSSDPAPGLFYLEVQQNGPSFWLLWNGSETYSTSGYWTGKLFSLVPEMAENDYVSNFTFASNENGSYFTYVVASSNNFIRIMLEITASATRSTCLFVAACKDLNPKSQKIGNYKITQMAI
ncbi:PREDICTED: G-type lectin S-receptor [Prunus dulcis]|uniref:PREDICTED: G-type lectin S-receptor n=2 Tax=Prunus dulcis TaxID=3755 RepID=A0A5E4GBL7_PRUDU|nr:PREDICTED: G-type lectin S-receptor [Prunus dulcis]